MLKTAMSVDAPSALALPSGAEHRRSGMWICFGGNVGVTFSWYVP